MVYSEHWSIESEVPTRWRVEWDEKNPDGTSVPRKITFNNPTSAQRFSKEMRELYEVYPTIKEL